MSTGNAGSFLTPHAHDQPDYGRPTLKPIPTPTPPTAVHVRLQPTLRTTCPQPSSYIYLSVPNMFIPAKAIRVWSYRYKPPTSLLGLVCGQPGLWPILPAGNPDTLSRADPTSCPASCSRYLLVPSHPAPSNARFALSRTTLSLVSPRPVLGRCCAQQCLL